MASETINSPIPALFKSQRPQEAVPLKLQVPEGNKRKRLKGLHGTAAWVANGNWELGSSQQNGLASVPGTPVLGANSSTRRTLRFSHANDGLARIARIEFFGDTVVFSCLPGAEDLERLLLTAEQWPSELLPFTFGAVEVDDRDASNAGSRSSLAMERPIFDNGTGKVVLGGPSSTPRPPGINFVRSTSTPSFPDIAPPATRSLSSYLWGSSAAPTASASATPLATKSTPSRPGSPALSGQQPVPKTPASFHCGLGALSAPLQPFLRSSHYSFLSFGTGNAAQAWDSEKPFAALPLDDPLPGWTRLGCPIPRVDHHRALYSLSLLLPPQSAWTGRPKMRITRIDLADELRPALLSEFEHAPCFPWCFAMSVNYIVVFGGPSECSLDRPAGVRRSFSFPRLASQAQMDGFLAPPTLKQSFEITKPTTYTVISKHTGQVLARLTGKAPGGIAREVLRAEDDRGIITLDLLLHADLSGHSARSLDSLRLYDGNERASPVRLARVTLDPLRGFATEQVLTHAPVSCFLPIPGGNSVAVSHPPWLSPGPHAWEASSFVLLDEDGEAISKLRPANGDRCVPAGAPMWIGEDGPEAVGLLGLPVIMLPDSTHALILTDPEDMAELARVVLPCAIPWLNSGAWIPPDDDARWESPVAHSEWSASEKDVESPVDVGFGSPDEQQAKGDEDPEVSSASSVGGKDDDGKVVAGDTDVEVVGESSVEVDGNSDKEKDDLSPALEQKETSPASVRTGWSADDAPVGGI